MILARNLGRTDRTIRIVLGVIGGITAIFVDNFLLSSLMSVGSVALIVGASLGT